MAFLVLDLEMTGGDPGWHEIIQIGACLFDHNWNELGRYITNVYRENEESFSLPAYEVHGLSKDDLEKAPMMYDVLPAFEDWIVEKLSHRKNLQAFERERLLKSISICGQSIVGDINFLRFAYRDENLKWPYSYNMLELQNITYFLFKVLRANGIETPKRRNLDAIAGFFGYSRESDIHNALEDAAITGFALRDALAYTEKLTLKEEA
jgi:DNA polymerase-3 subunit epsilon